MSLQYDAYLNKLNLVYDIYKMDASVKNLIMLKYDMLCTSIMSSSQDEIIKPDIVEYGTICCKTVVKQMLLSKDTFDPNNCTLEALLSLYNKLNTGNINETVDEIYKTFSDKIKSLGGLVTPIQNLDELRTALETMGISQIENYTDDDYMDDNQIIGLDADDSALLNSIFSDNQGDDIDTPDEQSEYTGEIFDAQDGFNGTTIEDNNFTVENIEPDIQEEYTDETGEEDFIEEDEDPIFDTKPADEIIETDNNATDELLEYDNAESDESVSDEIIALIGDDELESDNTVISVENTDDIFNIDIDIEEDDTEIDDELDGLLDSVEDDETEENTYEDIEIKSIEPEEENADSKDNTDEPTEEEAEPKKKQVDIRLLKEIPVMAIVKCLNNNTWEKPDETIKNYLNDYKYVELAFKNEFDYSSEMVKDYTNGLAKAVRVFGTLHYLNSIGMLEDNRFDNLKKKLSDRIVSESNKRVSAFALGIILAYDDGEIPYDKLPNQAMLNRLAKAAYAKTSERLIKNKKFKLEGELARLIETYGIGGDPTVYRENSMMAYDESNFSEAKIERKTFEKLPNGATILKPYKTQTVMAMKPELATIVQPYESPRDRLKLLYSRNGAQFLFEITWDLVLDSMSKSAGGDANVQRVAIAGTEIIVNNSKVFLDNLFDDRSGVELNSIADIEKLLMRFGEIKQLVVEASLIAIIVRKHIIDIPNLEERIINVLSSIFKLSNSLYRLGVIDTCGSINEPVWYYRNGLDESHDAIIKQLRFESIKPDIEAVCAMSSPLLHMKSRSYIHRFFDTAMSDSSTSMYILGKLRDQDISIKEMYNKSRSAAMTKLMGNTKRGVKNLTNIVKKKK